MIIGKLDLTNANAKVTLERVYVNETMMLDDLWERNISNDDYDKAIYFANNCIVPNDIDTETEKFFKKE